jgi:hypothetical protein
MTSEPIYVEKQGLFKSLIAIIVISMATTDLVLLTTPAFQQVIKTGFFSWETLKFFLGINLAIFLVEFMTLRILRLKTQVREDGIYIQFLPFIWNWKQFAWEDIQHWEVRQYSPIWEYGGWGIKGTRNNRAYNLWGKQGLQLVLKNGKKVLIGTQQPEDIKAAILRLGVPQNR